MHPVFPHGPDVTFTINDLVGSNYTRRTIDYLQNKGENFQSVLNPSPFLSAFSVGNNTGRAPFTPLSPTLPSLHTVVCLKRGLSGGVYVYEYTVLRCPIHCSALYKCTCRQPILYPCRFHVNIRVPS